MAVVRSGPGTARAWRALALFRPARSRLDRPVRAPPGRTTTAGAAAGTGRRVVLQIQGNSCRNGSPRLDHTRRMGVDLETRRRAGSISCRDAVEHGAARTLARAHMSTGIVEGPGHSKCDPGSVHADARSLAHVREILASGHDRAFFGWSAHRGGRRESPNGAMNPDRTAVAGIQGFGEPAYGPLSLLQLRPVCSIFA